MLSKSPSLTYLLPILFALLTIAGPAWAEGEGDGGVDFTDRIVVVNFKSRGDAIEYLKEVRLVEIGGHTCLVGMAVDSGFEEDRWVVDAEVIVDWSEVAYLYSLTPEQYHDMLEGSDSVITHWQ